ncbi:uncharacterized protein N7498_000470 [Penicillium cinerascens]|uniref:Cobalamin-independent methionine synthase MetE C-terminal/archaeal domain-containing protein n=1 Tax=Penicillium cinerascens TaxID=70096 RepID=A0A9W9NEG1_9EURO|nr:uncharacterized protein N7498_000470 [Penicillium cinerascens]KAJ5218371.1 hypothetical protein N7498_000470 [Penicillium cinerascens]
MTGAALPRPRRAEHLGSLLRPAELLGYASQDTNATARRQIENREITIVVNEQLKIGFKAVSDGEYRRSLFWGTFFDNLEGFEAVPLDANGLRTYLPDIKVLLESPFAPGASTMCTGKIRHPGSSNHLDEFLFLRSVVGPENAGNIKITIPAPSWYHFRHKDGMAYAKGVYDSDTGYFEDLAVVYRQELQILYDAGLRRVQIDDPHLSYLCSPQIIEDWAADPESIQTPTELLETYVNWYNSCLGNVPEDIHIGIHICRGNFTNDRYVSTGGYDIIASRLFRDLNVNTYYLEYDTPRAGGFEPLKSLPLNKYVVLGVISTKKAEMEDLEELKGRVYKAAEYIAEGNNVSLDVALERLAVSPQCGFASHCRENRLTRQNMLEKLQLVRDLAYSIWGSQA